MSDNGPNRDFPPAELIERAQAAGSVVAEFTLGDYKRLAEVARRMTATDYPQKPVSIKDWNHALSPGEIFRDLFRTAEGMIILEYSDGATVTAKGSFVQRDESLDHPTDPMMSQSIDLREYTIDYFSPDSWHIQARVTAEFATEFTTETKANLFFDGRDVSETGLTEDRVRAYEGLAERLRPLVDAVLVG